MTESDPLTDLKIMLGLSDKAFESSKDKLELILKNTQQRLLIKLQFAVEVVPDALQYIVVEVAVSRFNRLKNEGMKSYGQEGETITFADSDFDPFLDDIDAWLDKNNANHQTKGNVRFIGRTN